MRPWRRYLSFFGPNIVDDCRAAWRSLGRSPVFFASAGAVLALGIAVTVAVWSVANAVLVRPLPVHDQDRIIVMWARAPGASSEVSTTLERYARFRRATRTLAGVAGYAHYGATLIPLDDHGTALHGREALVTGNFFELLGMRPLLGRLLDSTDDVAGAAPVMVLSEAFWRSAFGADRHVVGRHVRNLNRELDLTIVGVAPAGFDFPSSADYWLPVVRVGYPAVDLVGRLANGATPATAKNEFEAFIANENREHPADASARSLRATGVEVQWLADAIVGPTRQTLIILAGAVAGLLLIACVNVGNLLLVRLTRRARELAVRRALGASSGRLAAHLGLEALVLTGTAALVGGALAFAALRVFVAAAAPALPRSDQISLSPTALIIATIATGVTLLLTGILPALFADRPLADTLRSDARGGAETQARRTLRSTLVAGQIALALVLLTTAALLARSLVRLEGINLGYVPSHLSIVQLTAPYHKYRSAAEFNAAFDGAQQRMREVPGVSAVTPVLAVPFIGSNVFAARIESRDGPELTGANAPYVSWDAVGPQFSAAMDAPIIRGRGISGQDIEGAPRVAVVTRDLADRYWPDQNPLGKQIRFAGSSSDTAWYTVVGEIRPINYRTLREATPTVLFSYHQQFQQGILAVRSSRDLTSMLPALRSAVRLADPDIVLWRARTMDQVLAEPLRRPRLETTLLIAFATTALLLAAIGLYAVVSYLVRNQTREFGIRIALGADSRHVLALALRDAIRVALIGVIAGGILSMAVSRLFTAELFDTNPADPLAIGVAGVALLVAAAIASYIPARRASRVDPLVALRSE